MSSTKRKTIKRIVGDCMTILTIVSIFVFSITCIAFIIFTFISSPASASEKSAADKFQEAMQYVSTLKNKVTVEENNIKVGTYKLKPEETFIDPKTKESWYTDSPNQKNYYGGITQNNAHNMEKEAIAETTKDYKDANGNPVPTPGKSVISSFQTRPIYKVTKDDDYMIKGNQLIKNSKGVITSGLDGDIKCKDGKEHASCESTYDQKTCNEEVRTIKKFAKKLLKSFL